MRLVADDEPVADVDAGGRQFVNLGKQGLRVHNQTIADDARNARVQDAGRQQAEHELPAVGVHRVSCVVAALIPRDDRKVRRQQVDDLALAFVTPLGAEYRNVHNCVILPAYLSPATPAS